MAGFVESCFLFHLTPVQHNNQHKQAKKKKKKLVRLELIMMMMTKLVVVVVVVQGLSLFQVVCVEMAVKRGVASKWLVRKYSLF